MNSEARKPGKEALSWIRRCDAHHRLLIAGGLALLVGLLTSGQWRIPVQIVLVWDVFGACFLGLSWVQILTAKPARYLSGARLQDSSQTTIFLSVLAGACMSLFAVGYLLITAKGLNKESLSGHVALAIVTVLCSWFLIHTLFALRYAHIFHGDGHQEKKRAGGVDFPQEPNPDYLDFAYFSFVIGMTCQVSDVAITGRRIRQLALVHGLVSFAFNAVILALSINVVSSLLAS